MAIEVIEDLVKGNTGGVAMYKGWQFTRVFKVTGIGGNGFDRIPTAINQPEIPNPNDTHPAEPTVIAKAITCISESSDIIELAVIYSAPNPLQPSGDDVTITTGSTLSQTDTNLDINGNILLTEYTYPVDYKETPEFAGKTFTHAGMVAKSLPETTRTFTRLDDDDPLIISSIYVGKVNSQTFQSGNPGTWMCTNIDGNSLNGGESFTVDYSFQFRIDGWTQQVVFISSDTGEPPVFTTPAELALGVRDYEIYDSIDFNQLGL